MVRKKQIKSDFLNVNALFLSGHNSKMAGQIVLAPVANGSQSKIWFKINVNQSIEMVDSE